MELANVTVNSLQLIVQVSYKILIILRFKGKFIYSLFVVLAFCNPNITCNGQGSCGNDGHCRCLDGLFGENCSGKLTIAGVFLSNLVLGFIKMIFVNYSKKTINTCCSSFFSNKNCKTISHFSIKKSNFSFEKQLLSTFFA